MQSFTCVKFVVTFVCQPLATRGKPMSPLLLLMMIIWEFTKIYTIKAKCIGTCLIRIRSLHFISEYKITYHTIFTNTPISCSIAPSSCKPFSTQKEPFRSYKEKPINAFNTKVSVWFLLKIPVYPKVFQHHVVNTIFPSFSHWLW